MLKVMLRRLLSSLKRFYVLVYSKSHILYYRAAYPGLALPFDAIIKSGAIISVTDGGSISIGRDVKFSRNCQVVARGGTLNIGDNVQIGDGAIITCMNHVEIGNQTLIAEYVVIRDQDHDYRSRPIRSSGFNSARIEIGADCWLGSKATVLRGSKIGDGAVIGAHALVRGNIDGYSLAVGAPAKIVKLLPRGSGPL